MRHLTLLVLIAPWVHAQIQDLAVTDDGSALYFSTPFRFVGTNRATYAKIFRYSDGGFDLFRQIARQPITPGTDTNSIWQSGRW